MWLERPACDKQRNASCKLHIVLKCAQQQYKQKVESVDISHPLSYYGQRKIQRHLQQSNILFTLFICRRQYNVQSHRKKETTVGLLAQKSRNNLRRLLPVILPTTNNGSDR